MPKNKPAAVHNSGPSSDTDQRQAYRILAAVTLRFSSRQRIGKTGAGLLADLSETGCRLQSTYPLKVGAVLALVAELPHPVLITETRVV